MIWRPGYCRIPLGNGPDAGSFAILPAKRSDGANFRNGKRSIKNSEEALLQQEATML